MIVARHILVTGKVQGVFFRAWTCEQAEALGVAGWIRNCADGSVEAHVEGHRAEVERLVERLHTGPSHAFVSRVEVKDVAPAGCASFVVRRE